MIDLPEDCGVNGVDDLLAVWGPERVLALFAKAIPGASPAVTVPTQYRATQEGMFREWFDRNEQLNRRQLSNFQAWVTKKVILDDGVSTKLDFEITVELMGQRSTLAVPASEFAALNWPIEHLGPAAVIFPKLKEDMRAAIQLHSLTAIDQRIYTHTGWRQVDKDWVFLHAGGAIGAFGVVNDVAVQLPTALRDYKLQLPQSEEASIRSIQASLRTLDLALRLISFLLLAATYRSAMGASDFFI